MPQVEVAEGVSGSLGHVQLDTFRCRNVIQVRARRILLVGFHVSAETG